MSIATALRCPRCPDHTAQAIGLLAAHLANDHLVAAFAALKEAREIAAGVATPPEMERPPATRAEVLADPFGLDRNGIKKHATKGDTMPRTPKPCKLCARFAPEKCKHHGGPSRSTSAKARRERKVPTRARPGGGTRSKPARKPRPVAEGNGAIADNGVKGHALALVGELLALRDRLDEKIKHVRELAEIL